MRAARARSLEIDLPIFYVRHVPIEGVGEAAMAIEASGVVDSVTVWDQLTFHVPPALWRPEYTPLATALPDIDSMPDAFATLGYIAAVAPGLGLTTSPDAVRRGPGELMQSMLTLSDFTRGRATFQMGAGEIKQTKPFGHKRTQGLKRLEDQFRIYRRFLENDGPIDHEGNVWNMDQAWLGESYGYRPRLFALGGGPETDRSGDELRGRVLHHGAVCVAKPRGRGRADRRDEGGPGEQGTRPR